MELLEAVKKVLEWYAEDASDNVARRAVMYDLQEAYDNASQHSVQSDGAVCTCFDGTPYKPHLIEICDQCGNPPRN